MGLQVLTDQVVEGFLADQFGYTGEVLRQHIAQPQEVRVGVDFQPSRGVKCPARLDGGGQFGLELILARLAGNRSPEPGFDLTQFWISHGKPRFPPWESYRIRNSIRDLRLVWILTADATLGGD